MPLDAVKHAIRDIPDFPKPGILFKDITPILLDPDLFREACAPLIKRAKELGVDKVAAIESRGFLFGAVIAHELGIGIIPVRKAGKLPADTVSVSYELEYGEATLEVHIDAAAKGDRVVIVDDLLATGGTAEASIELIEKLGAEVVETFFLVELSFLNGRERLKNAPIFCPIVY